MEILSTDFLILGSGVAGLQAAVHLAPYGKVLLLTKSKVSESSSEYAQGGVAVVLSDEDSLELHYEDTIRAGAGLCHPDAVQILVQEGPAAAEELIQHGARFDTTGSQLAFTKEAAHSAKRVLHAGGDATGHEVMRVLRERSQRKSSVEVRSHAFVRDLRIQDGICAGAFFTSSDTGQHCAVAAKAVLLATGGAGRLFLETTNPPVATGDGLAMAYRAGAVLADLEFYQFHPTALYLTGAPRFLLTEALRGEGGRLVNLHGEPFMKKYHESGDLAPRDVVARSILLEARLTNHPCAYLELAHLGEDFIRRRFPAVHRTCQAYGLDISKQRVPILPAAHYAMGGVWTDVGCATTMPGLYAAGEVACNGVHGANRLASNSLLEGLVFGKRAAASMLKASAPRPRKETLQEPRFTEHFIQPETKRDILTLAWEKVGVFRRKHGLERAIEHLERLLPTLEGDFSEPWAAEVQNIALNVWLMARSALAREESRGAHYRDDCPDHDPRLDGIHSFASKGREVRHSSIASFPP
jgi:L-aspartate oxidase